MDSFPSKTTYKVRSAFWIVFGNVCPNEYHKFQVLFEGILLLNQMDACCFCLEFSPCFEGLSFKKRNVDLESTVGSCRFFCTLNPRFYSPLLLKVPACQTVGKTRFCEKKMLPRNMSAEDIKKEVAKSLDILTHQQSAHPASPWTWQRFVVTNYKVGAPTIYNL